MLNSQLARVEWGSGPELYCLLIPMVWLSLPWLTSSYQCEVSQLAKFLKIKKKKIRMSPFQQPFTAKVLIRNFFFFNSEGSLIMEKFACRSIFFKVFYNNICSLCPWRFIDRVTVRQGDSLSDFWTSFETMWFQFLKSLPLHCGYNPPGYLLPLNKPSASSALFSSVERPVGAGWLSLLFLEDREAIQAPASEDSL